MIDANTFDKLLQELTNKTRSMSIEWVSLPQYFEKNDNETLRKYIIDSNRYAYSDYGIIRKNRPPIISEYKSKCVCINDGIISLLLLDSGKTEKEYGLIIQINKYASVNRIECTKEQQKQIKDLLALIDEDQSDLAKYIKSILE